MNVPPIDRAPGSLQGSASYRKGMAEYIGAFNFRLQYLAENLTRIFPDSTVFQLDTNWLFTLTLNYPKYFAETSGFKDTTSYCPVYERQIFLTQNAERANMNVGVPQHSTSMILHVVFPSMNTCG